MALGDDAVPLCSIAEDWALVRFEIRQSHLLTVQDRENPKTGEVERVELGTPRRLKTIYVTNAWVARAVGQWERIQRTKDARPWLV